MSRDGNDVVSQSASTYGSHDDSSHQQQVRFYEYFCVLFYFARHGSLHLQLKANMLNFEHTTGCTVAIF